MWNGCGGVVVAWELVWSSEVVGALAGGLGSVGHTSLHKALDHAGAILRMLLRRLTTLWPHSSSRWGGKPTSAEPASLSSIIFLLLSH